jgi:hypothetical protein
MPFSGRRVAALAAVVLLVVAVVVVVFIGVRVGAIGATARRGGRGGERRACDGDCPCLRCDRRTRRKSRCNDKPL